MRTGHARRSQNVAEMAIVIIHVLLASELESAFFEAKNPHDSIVKFLGLVQIGHRNVNMIDSDDVRHDYSPSAKRIIPAATV